MPMPNSNEKHRKVGVRLVIRRKDTAGIGEWYDFGVFDAPPAPNTEVQTLDSYDERGGASVLDESVVTRYSEKLTLRGRNVAFPRLADFYGAAAPGVTAQASQTVTDQVVVAKRGKYIALTPASGANSGNRVFNVTGVQINHTSGTPVYVAGTDYILDAPKGLAFIPTNSAITDGQSVHCDYTVPAMTANALVLPQTAIQGVEVEAEIWEVADTGAAQLVRQIPNGRLRSTGQRTIGVTVDNSLEFELAILNDPLSATPAGTLKQIAGT